jgi:hypothetical protein
MEPFCLWCHIDSACPLLGPIDIPEFDIVRKRTKIASDKTAFSQAQRNCKTKTTAENLNI